jgi:NADH:ubiquinone oxidoreductase subunit E
MMDILHIDIDKQIGQVGDILGGHEKKHGVLIHVLHQIQEDQGYLPEDTLKGLSKALSLPLSEIYSVASFYKMFHFRPRGRKVVKVCMGTACYVRGAKKVLDALENEFAVKNGGTSEDLAMTLETVGCVGCCGLAPVSTINDEVMGEIAGGKNISKFIDMIKDE